MANLFSICFQFAVEGLARCGEVLSAADLEGLSPEILSRLQDRSNAVPMSAPAEADPPEPPASHDPGGRLS
jgi:hypothetical protein